MTWTKEDTEALRYAAAGLSEYEPSPDGKLGTEHPTSGTLLVRRAADEIERLQARVARFETEYDCHPQGGVPGCDCWECLRTRIAELEAANHELRVLYEDGKLHADEMVDLLQDRIAALKAERDEQAALRNTAWERANEANERATRLEAERADVARELRALGKKIRDAYTHADDLAPGEAHGALAPIHGLALRVSAVAARLERKVE